VRIRLRTIRLLMSRTTSLDAPWNRSLTNILFETRTIYDPQV
jgi:hypothetical protein